MDPALDPGAVSVWAVANIEAHLPSQKLLLSLSREHWIKLESTCTVNLTTSLLEKNARDFGLGQVRKGQ